MALVKLSYGASVNPESLKYITIDAKRIEGQIVYGLLVRLDDNSEHWVAGFTDRQEAIDEVKKYSDALNKADS